MARILSSSAVRVHDSQAYTKMDVIRERISRSMELREILLSFQTVSNLSMLLLFVLSWRVGMQLPEEKKSVADHCMNSYRFVQAEQADRGSISLGTCRNSLFSRKERRESVFEGNSRFTN